MHITFKADRLAGKMTNLIFRDNFGKIQCSVSVKIVIDNLLPLRSDLVKDL